MQIKRYSRREFGTPESVAGATAPVTIDTDIGGEIGKHVDEYYTKKGHVLMMQTSIGLEDGIRAFEEIAVGKQLGKAPPNTHSKQEPQATYIQASEIWFDKTSGMGRKKIPEWLQPEWDDKVARRRDAFLDRAAVRQQRHDDEEESSVLSKSLDSHVQRAYSSPEQAFDQLISYTGEVDVLHRPDGELVKLSARDEIITAAVDGFISKDPSQALEWLEKSKKTIPYEIYEYGIKKATTAIRNSNKETASMNKALEQQQVMEYKLKAQGIDAYHKEELVDTIRRDGSLSDGSKSSLLAFVNKGPRIYGDGVIYDNVMESPEKYDLSYIENLHTGRQITDFEYQNLKTFYSDIQNSPNYKDQCGIAAGLIDSGTFGSAGKGATALDRAKNDNMKRRTNTGIAKAMAAGYEPEQARLEAMRSVKLYDPVEEKMFWPDKRWTDEDFAREVYRRAKDMGIKSVKPGTVLYNEIIDDILFDIHDYPEGVRRSYHVEEGRVELKILQWLSERGLRNTEKNRDEAIEKIKE